MKRISVVLMAAALLSIGVGSAFAANLTGTVTRFGTAKSSAPGVKIVASAALTSSDNVTAVWDASELISYFDGGSSVIASGMAWGFNSTTAGDSATVAIAGSMTPTGPWTDIYASTLQANTLTGAAPIVAKDDAYTVLLPWRYHRITATGKGASMATTKFFFVVYPRVRP